MANKKKKTIAAGVSTTIADRWKPPIFLYIAGAVIGIYFAVITASTWEAGDNIYTFFPRLSQNFNENMFNINAKNIKNMFFMAINNPGVFFKSLAVYEFFIGVFIIYDLSKERNFMPGKEFGTARWASFDKINKKFEEYNKPSWNRIYSENIRISMDSKINNNVLVIGGSGVGKSFYLLTPNVYQADPESEYPGSLIFTDPKGELLQNNGAYLKSKGYVIKVLNLVTGMMHESDCFNPLAYIRSEIDIIKLINNLFANTTPKTASAADPFWEKAELMLLQSLFLIVWMEHERYGWTNSINTVMWLLSKAKIGDDADEMSELDMIFNQLVSDTIGDERGGEMHPAWLAYNKVMVGAADTKRSIVISANARLAIFENPDVKRILEKDELDLASIGTGLVDGRKKVKTALFCVIPDSDTSYNCIAGMLYTLLFQELYFQADFMYKGKLPVPVTFWMDEFANIALPSDFTKQITTMRSRRISCVVIIQNLSQLKTLFEKDWEQITGSCDVCVYLGGNEQSTFEYISKNLGKRTIAKRSQGITRGSHGSSSTNTDGLGREQMLPEEVREIDNDYCIIFIRGQKPVFDHKFRTQESPEFEKSKKLGAYLHSAAKKQQKTGKILFAAQDEIQEALESGKLIQINLDESGFQTPEMEELMAIAVANKEEEERVSKKNIDIADIELFELLQRDDFVLTDDLMEEVSEGIKNGLTDEQVKEYVLFDDKRAMRAKRLMLEAMNDRMRKSTIPIQVG